MPTLLVVDDETYPAFAAQPASCPLLDRLEVISVPTAAEALDLARSRPPDAVLLDANPSDMAGLEAFDRLRALDPRLPVIFITAHGAMETAIEAMKRGAFDCLLKPVDSGHLYDVVARAVTVRQEAEVRSQESGVRNQQAEVRSGDGDPCLPAPDPWSLAGRSPAMQEVFKAIGRVAGQDMTVLILGESGTGKELVARAIYHHGRRRQGLFLTINCAAIPEALLESELFGHERGAFTGADRLRIGKFEQADGGTIFLDEIGDMATATQAKVLRLLQEQRFERLGGNRTIKTDVRLIAATNQNLEELVAAGRFRRDLFYRLKVFTITLPPLRDRLDDLPLLVDHFIKLFNPGLGKQVQAAAVETLALLGRHDWPGNIRELQSAIKYALVHASGDVLTPDCLHHSLRPRAAPATAVPVSPGDASARLDIAALTCDLLQAGELEIYRKVTREVDRIVLETVLRHVKGSQVQASEWLGISRTTLRAKLRALDMAGAKEPVAA
jgi:two-component system nitrogen regulation response regulator GlnG